MQAVRTSDGKLKWQTAVPKKKECIVGLTTRSFASNFDFSKSDLRDLYRQALHIFAKPCFAPLLISFINCTIMLLAFFPLKIGFYYFFVE